MKTRLGYLCSSQSWGGLEMNHLRNAKWMQDRGHDVVVICIKQSPIDLQASEYQLPVIHIEPHKKYFDFAKGKVLAQLLVSSEISHLIIRSTFDVSITAIVKRKLKDRIHTSYFMEMQMGVKKTNVLHTLRFKGLDVWSCPLTYLRKQVEAWTKFENELVVIPSGLDLGQFEGLPSKQESRKILDITIPENDLLLGLIGRFDEQKGQLLLLEALQKSGLSQVHVVLLGEPTLHEGDDYFNRVQAYISANDLEQRVTIRPFRKDIANFYNAIDWLVMATKAETFGMVTLEALASGTPVLGSDGGGTPELLDNEKGGILFTSQDSNDLAEKLSFIVSERPFYDADELRKMAAKFDHQDVCEMVEKTLGIAHN